MGWFKHLHSDLGSSFVSKIIKRINKAFKITNLYANAGDHRGIGSIERRIRILKDALQKWNLELSKQITDKNEDVVRRCEIIDLAHSFIMFGMNQSISSFTLVSPNMQML